MLAMWKRKSRPSRRVTRSESRADFDCRGAVSFGFGCFGWGCDHPASSPRAKPPRVFLVRLLLILKPGNGGARTTALKVRKPSFLDRVLDQFGRQKSNAFLQAGRFWYGRK